MKKLGLKILILFDECNSLSILDVSKFNTQNVENMAGMFKGCKIAEILDLKPNTVSVILKRAKESLKKFLS